jgi:hypothetical protein
MMNDDDADPLGKAKRKAQTAKNEQRRKELNDADPARKAKRKAQNAKSVQRSRELADAEPLRKEKRKAQTAKNEQRRKELNDADPARKEKRKAQNSKKGRASNKKRRAAAKLLVVFAAEQCADSDDDSPRMPPSNFVAAEHLKEVEDRVICEIDEIDKARRLAAELKGGKRYRWTRRKYFFGALYNKLFPGSRVIDLSDRSNGSCGR